MELDFTLEDQRLSDECGCPEEEYTIGLCYIIAHLEPDNSVHLFLDMGDWNEEVMRHCDGTVEGMRLAAINWAKEIHERTPKAGGLNE